MRELIRNYRYSQSMLQSGAKSVATRKQRIGVLGLWFILLIGVRVVIGYFLHDVWLGTAGAVAITFLIFYAAIRYTWLQRYRNTVNIVLLAWYKKRFFIVSAAVTMIIFASILVLIQYGYSHFASKLVTVTFGSEDLGQFVRASAHASGSDSLARYSPADIAAITVASADKSMNGYYSKIVMYMLAEDAEITGFLIIMRGKKEIFPEVKPQI
jgi:signal transduction histidine kinase